MFPIPQRSKLPPVIDRIQEEILILMIQLEKSQSRFPPPPRSVISKIHLLQPGGL